MFITYNDDKIPQISVFFDTDQSVITKITRDAKRTWSDKISWVNSHFQLSLFLHFLMSLGYFHPILAFSNVCYHFPDWRKHGSFHGILSDQRDRTDLLDLVQGDALGLLTLKFSPQVVFHKKDQVVPVSQPEAPPPPPSPHFSLKTWNEPNWCNIGASPTGLLLSSI